MKRKPLSIVRDYALTGTGPPRGYACSKSMPEIIHTILRITLLVFCACMLVRWAIRKWLSSVTRRPLRVSQSVGPQVPFSCPVCNRKAVVGSTYDIRETTAAASGLECGERHATVIRCGECQAESYVRGPSASLSDLDHTEISRRIQAVEGNLAEWRRSLQDFPDVLPATGEVAGRRLTISAVVTRLHADRDKHEDVGPCLKKSEIQRIERRLDVSLSPSYATFLTEFGDGAYWLYGAQAVDHAHHVDWLPKNRPNVPARVTYQGSYVASCRLYCLMTEDSNGGAWCWLPDFTDENGEQPLGYYDSDRTVHFRVNFVDWLNLLVEHKDEVVRRLDKDGALGLG